MIHRATDAARLNEIMNDPAVRPWVANDADGALDLTPVVANTSNVALVGEHGGMVFLALQKGIYEVHTSILPAGRGEWGTAMMQACMLFMFTRTDAYELSTRVPRGHIAAKAAAQGVGMRYEFTRPDGCVFRNRRVDVDLYSYRVQDWMAIAPGLAEAGRWFHERLESEAKRLGVADQQHDPDQNHNRYVGAAVLMAFGGQVQKGVALYNRWVSLARQSVGGKLQHVQILSLDPPVVRFDLGLLRFHADDIEVIRQC